MKNFLSYRNTFFNWVRNTLIGLIVIGAIFAFLITDSPAIANEEEVTVPINQVVKMDKLSAEQLAKAKVTVPRSWVSEDYLEEHFPQEKAQPEDTDTKSPGKNINNIPDGTMTVTPKIINEHNESITVSNFHFEFNYDQGNLKESSINFTVKNESGDIEDTKLLLNGNKQLTPDDGDYDEATEEFSHDIKSLEEGNLYEGTLKVRGGNESDSVEFQIYPRMYLNIANDDNINIGAHYYIWYKAPGMEGSDWDEYAFEPEVGPYDSRNPEVTAKHIDWATGHGIDFFIPTWFDRGRKYDDWLDKRLERFLENPLASEIKYALLYAGSELKPNQPLADFSNSKIREKFLSGLQEAADTYFEDENYLKINGKPLVYIWSHNSFAGPFEEVMDEVNEYTKEALGESIYWVSQQFVPVPSYRKERDSANAMANYGPLNHYRVINDEDRTLNTELIDKWYTSVVSNSYFAAKDSQIHYIPEVVLGFNLPPSLTGGEDIPSIERNPQGLLYEISQAKRFIDPDLNTIVITSFNEWPESTAIEPSKEWGTRYLKIIKDELVGYKPTQELVKTMDHIEFKFNKTVSPGGKNSRNIAVAFHRIEFSNSIRMVNSTLTIDIGSPKGRKYLGEGWFFNEKDPESDLSFVWAGGPKKESSLYIPKEIEAKYMQLKGDTAWPEIKADVYLNGEKVDTIDFRKGTHKYKVTLGGD